MLDLEPIRQRLAVQTRADFLALFEECQRLQRIEVAARALYAVADDDAAIIAADRALKAALESEA